MSLPAPRRPGATYRIGLVCLGNICRSPMADVVLSAKLDRAGLAGRVEVASSGTGDWHVGKPMDRRAAATLVGSGYDPSQHRAQQFEASWLRDFDLVLAMDDDNRRDVAALVDPAERTRPAGGHHTDRLHLFRDFDPVDDGHEVPDPYYGGEEGFTEVLAMVERTANNLVDRLARDLVGTGG